MPWKEIKPMDEKLKFIAYALEGSRPISHICEAMNISRKTGYKWMKRYSLEGLSGLTEKSRAPKSCPHKLSEKTELKIVKLRKQYPTWGAPKLHAYLERHKYSGTPSIAAIGRVLKRNDLIIKQDRGRKKEYKRRALTLPNDSNDVWTVDFKGDFKSSCGKRTYPLTVSDLFSRYLLCCESQTDTSFETTKANFSKVFQTYGLPKVIRSDNGVPFASGTGLSRLAVWWMDLGIKSELTYPGRPQENGAHERMHRTLKEDAIDPKKFDFHKQRDEFKKFLTIYNKKRPHAGISNHVPADLYKKSTRRMPKKILSPEYPSNYKVLKVNNRGNLYYKRKRWFFTHSLVDRWVGMEPMCDGLWRIYYRDNDLGYLDENYEQIFMNL